MLTSELDSETLAARLAGAKEAADAAKDDAKDVADLRLSDLEHVKQSLAL
jgi:hypothetical protein